MNSEVSTDTSVQHTSKQVATSSNNHDGKSEEGPFYPPERSICVSPLPKSVSRDELVHFLHQFGAVKRERFRRRSFIIEYYNNKPVEVLMSKTYFLQNEKLCLKKKIDCDVPKNKKKTSPIPTEGKKVVENIDPINYNLICHVILKEVTFDRELAALLNEIQLSDAELMTRYKVICPHLTDIFKLTFPECTIFSFGSTVAGLSFKECDLDIYMYLGKIGLPSFFNQPNLSQQIITTVIFKRVRKIMYSMKFIFADIIAIPKAKTPIIKFRYLPTNVSCDISFKNGLGVYKSNFLRYCTLRDVRLKPLMLLIKYWAKHLGITGGGRISNYGLVCLVIFYFQQVDLLPPLLELQRNCMPLIINGWQVNFDENTPLPPSSNTRSIPQLFHDFVSFYAEFIFSSRVLCLLDGKIYAASDFVNFFKLPDYMHRYKSYVTMNNTKKLDIERAMCVQDPFELDQNTTAITPERVLIAFHRCCAFSLEICQSVSEDNYNDLLKTLFGRTPPNMVPPKKKKKIYKKIIPAGQYIKAGLPANFEQRTDIVDKEQNIKENWYYVVFNLIKDIYEMVFKLQVEVLFDHDTKRQKIATLSDVHTKNHKKITFYCTGNKCVWRNRKKNNRMLLDVQLSALEKEAIVSDKVLEQLVLEQQNDATNIQLNFFCTLEKMDPTAVSITMSSECAGNIFRCFECFADSIISKIIEKTLLHMLQFQKTYSQLLQNRQPSPS
ncbi:speckle targeted PIP5K1A-regulated poly(A) polymerase [Harpegnathos saltator]|uniref:U6 snRNA-specific terminal uridylyltransferase 1 n=1 Tax=Harpegnathos saltator TaxID=610380 RepID=E2CA51_HARSA|nr:speckle targeted PIP5K1A-regulated poly(A) polymerase [Harpegnathos saltator]EFN75206.1 U6 snRNA-specific terminal uridylyltransferase 1 [Harpegnathos saltator]